MPNHKKRTYNIQTRSAQAAQTKKRILDAAKKLFKIEGFEGTTIEELAHEAQVSAPTIYALFQSKRGILRVIMDEAFSPNQFEALVEQSRQEASGKERIKLCAKIARNIYDAERAQMEIFRGASVLSPEFKELEKEREARRYERQKPGIEAMVQEKILAPGIDQNKARDIVWAFTGRDLYRLLVIERGWSPDEYEQWLAQTLTKILVKD